jgi:hypothetical protein
LNAGGGEIFLDCPNQPHSASSTTTIRSFPGVKGPKRSADNPNSPSAWWICVRVMPSPPLCARIGTSWGDLCLYHNTVVSVSGPQTHLQFAFTSLHHVRSATYTTARL